MDDPKRERLLRQATEVAAGDVGVALPRRTWATCKAIAFVPSMDERTLRVPA